MKKNERSKGVIAWGMLLMAFNAGGVFWAFKSALLLQTCGYVLAIFTIVCFVIYFLSGIFVICSCTLSSEDASSSLFWLGNSIATRADFSASRFQFSFTHAGHTMTTGRLAGWSWAQAND